MMLALVFGIFSMSIFWSLMLLEKQRHIFKPCFSNIVRFCTLHLTNLTSSSHHLLLVFFSFVFSSFALPPGGAVRQRRRAQTSTLKRSWRRQFCTGRLSTDTGRCPCSCWADLHCLSKFNVRHRQGSWCCYRWTDGGWGWGDGQGELRDKTGRGKDIECDVRFS